MKKYLTLLTLSLTLSSFAQQPVSVKTLLAEMTDASSVARLPAPAYTMKQASSYDRRSVSVDSPGWYANTDQNQFIRKEAVNGHAEYVMMDAEGPGAIVRFWLTTTIKPGRIRFYLDHSTTPVFESNGYDLMKMNFDPGPALLNPHSSYEPNGKGGNTMYFPIPYQKHCQVTLELPDSAAIKAPHYYQINYRTYVRGTKVQTFAKTDLQTFRPAIDQAEKTLWSPPVYTGGKLTTKGEWIKSSGKTVIALPPGSAAIRSLDIKVVPPAEADLAVALRSVILKIDFDGRQTVWCPLGDFSGSGYGGKPVKSWYRGIEQQRKDDQSLGDALSEDSNCYDS